MLDLLLITFCLRTEQFCLEGRKLVDRLSPFKIKLLLFCNIAVAAKKRLKETLWPSSAHSWVNVILQTETLTLSSEVTSAGHQQWGWISATQASPVYDINKLVSNVLGTVDAGWKTFVSANNRPELVWIGKANRHFLSYLKEYLSLGSLFIKRCELNVHHLLFVPSQVFPVISVIFLNMFEVLIM